jgi:hypothetical protein
LFMSRGSWKRSTVAGGMNVNIIMNEGMTAGDKLTARPTCAGLTA